MSHPEKLTVLQKTLAGIGLVFLGAATIVTWSHVAKSVSISPIPQSSTELVMAPSAPTKTVSLTKRGMLTAGTSSKAISDDKNTAVREVVKKKTQATHLPKNVAETILSAAKMSQAASLSAPAEPTIEIDELLRGHNTIRKQKGLSPLSWSSELALGAQAWSKVLKGEGCGMRHDYTSGYGENIYWRIQTGGSVSQMISDATAANRAWIEEEEFYDYENNSCAPNEQCGHYTQIVWADTKEVGCGVSSCIIDDSRTDVWVCRYNPHGNTTGQKPY